MNTFATGRRNLPASGIEPLQGARGEESTASCPLPRSRLVGAIVAGRAVGLRCARSTPTFYPYFMVCDHKIGASALRCALESGRCTVLRARLPHTSPHSLSFNSMLTHLLPSSLGRPPSHLRRALVCPLRGHKPAWASLPQPRYRLTASVARSLGRVGKSGSLRSPDGALGRNSPLDPPSALAWRLLAFARSIICSAPSPLLWYSASLIAQLLYRYFRRTPVLASDTQRLRGHDYLGIYECHRR